MWIRMRIHIAALTQVRDLEAGQVYDVVDEKARQLIEVGSADPVSVRVDVSPDPPSAVLAASFAPARRRG